MVVSDHSDMRCDDCREAISAGLDGEELPGEEAAVSVHLDGCAECRLFADRAARITRLTRTRLVEPVPDQVATVVAAAPRDRSGPARRRPGANAVRLALGAVGLAQFALAVAGLIGASGGHAGPELVGASAAHLVNESSAWNAALAVAFLGGAARTGRTSGLLPALTVFVAVLAVVSVADAVAGRVDAARLLGHGVAVLGVLLLLVLNRTDDDGGVERHDTPDRRRTGDRSVRTLRHRSEGDGLAPTARHRAA